MALRLRKLLLAVAGGTLAALCAGAISVTADSIESDGSTTVMLNRFVIADNGNRVITGSVAQDQITQEGWYVSESDQLYYYYSDGTCATEETTLEDGYTYVFAADGTLKTGWQMVDGKRYYYNAESGTPAFGWLSYQENLYYVDTENGKLTGIQEIDGVPYSFDTYGCVQTGWITYEDGRVYYYGEDAAPASGWTQMETGTYYFTADGGAATGITEIDGNSYYFTADGVLQTGGFLLAEGGVVFADDAGVLTSGMAVINGDTYFFGSDYFMQTGWIETENGKCYCNSVGVMQTGFQIIDGAIYYLDPTSGCVKTSWQVIGNAVYYFDETGKMVTGWMEISQGKIYLTENGMATGITQVDGSTYCFSEESGAMLTGLQQVDGKLYYFNTTTGVMETGWITVSGNVYYMTTTGAYTGLKEIAGKTYYFDPTTAIRQTGWITTGGMKYYFDPDTGAMTESAYASVELDVPDYKQFDSQWASVKVGSSSSTIKQVGCLTTCIAMKYSYETGTNTTPDKIMSKLSYSGDNLLWVSFTNLGYTMESPSNTSLSQTDMQKIYNSLLSGKPVIIGAKTASGGQHYVLVTGYTGASGSTTFALSDFIINDPGSSTRTRLDEFFAIYTKLYRIVY